MTAVHSTFDAAATLPFINPVPVPPPIEPFLILSFILNRKMEKQQYITVNTGYQACSSNSDIFQYSLSPLSGILLNGILFGVERYQVLRHPTHI